MQKNHFLRIAQRNRELMIEQGLSPELLVKYLEQTAELQRVNFEIIKPMLSPADRDYILGLMLQGELLLDIVRRSATLE